MKRSARLKMGPFFILMQRKSITYPLFIRSIKFPMAPPIIQEIPILKENTLSFNMPKYNKTEQAIIEMKDIAINNFLLFLNSP